jgi:hypothetical protein
MKLDFEKVPKMAEMTSQSSSPLVWYHDVHAEVVSAGTGDGFVVTVRGIGRLLCTPSHSLTQ